MYFSTKSKEAKHLLNYYLPLQTTEGYTLSVDKVAVDYLVKGPDALTSLGRLLERLPIHYAIEIQHWESFKIGSFRQNYTVTFQDGNSFWLGVGLNSTKTEWNRVRLEVNPNKCAMHASFLEILTFLNRNSRPMHTKIKRFDLAIDIAVERENARLIKDGRVYSERRHGKEWTEYLGAQTSHVGRVKLYNKQAEAGLSYPLTRLEVTLDPATPFEKIPWPEAYYIHRQQMDIDEMSITNTERYILSALLSGYGNTKDLCRKTKEKMEKLLTRYVQYIRITEEEYAQALTKLRGFVTSPERGLGAIEADQPPQVEKRHPVWTEEEGKSPFEEETV